MMEESGLEAPSSADKEVKPSWTMSHIMLTVTLSLLTGVVGYGLKFLFESPQPQPIRVLAVRKQISANLLGLDERARTGIVASYRLREAPTKQLLSYFQYRFRVKNAGNVGADDIQIMVENRTDKVTLVKSPAISTDPVNIRDAISPVQINQNGNLNVDEWKIPLLNPGEAVEFTYVAYSDVSIDKAELSAVARKKDWQTISEGEQVQTQSRSRFDRPLAELRGIDLLEILILYLFIQSIFSLYMFLFLNMPPVRRILKRWGRR